MRKFKNAAETLDALEEELLWGRQLAEARKSEYRPCLIVVSLYRLAEVQLDLWARLGGSETSPGSYQEYERELERFERHERLGMWIVEQP